MPELRPLQLLCATVSLDSSLPGWTLHLPEEVPRTFRREITFESRFPGRPLVQVALCGFDMDNAASGRIRARAVEVHAGGFTLEVETWLNTRVYGVDVSWLAVGSA